MPATINVRYLILDTCHKMSATVNVRYLILDTCHKMSATVNVKQDIEMLGTYPIADIHETVRFWILND